MFLKSRWKNLLLLPLFFVANLAFAKVDTEEEVLESNKPNVVQITEEVQIPDSNRKVRFQFKEVHFKTQFALRSYVSKLNNYEHRSSGEVEKNIKSMRTWTFWVINTSSVVVWTVQSMQWDMKLIALLVSSVSNYFFIMYENTLDERVYDQKLLRNLFQVPLEFYYKVLAKLKKLSNGEERLLRLKAFQSGYTYGKILGITLVNYMYLYLYKYLVTPDHGFFTEDIFMKSLEALTIFVGTSTFLQGIRGNLKKYGREYLSEIVVHRAAIGMTLLSGLSFVVLATEVVSPEALAVGLGVPSAIGYIATKKQLMKFSLGKFKKWTKSICSFSLK